MYKELKGYRQILFTLGHIGPGSLSQFITIWLMLYLTTGEQPLVSAALVGTALLLGGLVDALADPFVANWSDNFKNAKFGRRIPFMLGGLLPMVLSFVALWYTAYITTNATIRFIWVLVMLKLFYFTYTIVVNPYFALLPEIAESKKQRLFIQSFVALFGILGMGFAMGASGFMIEAFGYGVSSIIMGIICLLVMIGPALTVRLNNEKSAEKSQKTEESQKKNMFAAVISAIQNTTFRRYITGFCIFFLGFQLIQFNMAFITTVLLGLEPGMSSILFISSVVSGLALIPVYNLIMKKLTAINALKLAVGAFVVVSILMTFLPIFVDILGNALVVGFAIMILLGFPYAGLMVIPNVLVSEIIDEDIRKNGIHREAMFFGVQGLINKIMVAIASFIVGLILSGFGNSIEQPLGVILIGPLAAVAALVGFIVMLRLNIEGAKT
ncbi:MAG: MFS transporter [Firmicutes bacterium]|nr:MFS transporter [Bacillota bacterium]